ncbi:VOC family protein [Mycolicibacterium chubuense]|uniref:VOC family protein n=1 Tax=Mycolicibacterium chubuense TaxID=1800 RepID=UPI0009DAE208|nr:VOC family protein [Mycolicibacterium chubuense]
MPEIKGFSHVQLTVSSSDRASRWWQEVMGFTEVIRYRRDAWEAVSLLHPNGMTVGLMDYDDSTDDRFDERRTGLDHLSFEVSDRDELTKWVTHLDTKGVEHSGINDTDFGPIVAFRDPDNIQLEFFVHPRVDQVTELLTDGNSEEARRMLDEAELRSKSQGEAI